MKWRIAVIDPDTRYRDRFLAQWKTKPNEGIELEWMTDVASFLEASRHRIYDRLLVDSGVLDKQTKEEVEAVVSASNIFFWQDRTDERGPAKYQPVSRLRQDLLYLLSRQRSSEPTTDLGGQLIFCTALKGGLGVSTVTQALAGAYRRLFPDEHVFYFGLQPFWNANEIFALSDYRTALPYTLADVVLAMRMPAADVDLRLAACIIEQSGVDTFLPPRRPADFFDISKEEWIRLLRTVKKRESCVLVDCPAGWLWQFPQLFSVADRLLIFTDGMEEEGMRAFLEAIPYTWEEGRDAFLERGNTKRRTRAFSVPFLPGKSDASAQRRERISALSISSSIEEVVRWMHV